MGIVVGVVGVAQPVVAERLPAYAAVEALVRCGVGAPRVEILAGVLVLEGGVPLVVAFAVLVIDPRGSVEVVVLDLLGDGLGAVGPFFGDPPVAALMPPPASASRRLASPKSVLGLRPARGWRRRCPVDPLLTRSASCRSRGLDQLLASYSGAS